MGNHTQTKLSIFTHIQQYKYIFQDHSKTKKQKTCDTLLYKKSNLFFVLIHTS